MRAPTAGDSPSWVSGALILTLAVVAVIVGPTGCGGKTKHPAPSSTTTASTVAQFEVGNMLNYGSVGTTAELDCADGKSLNVGGGNNTLTVKGTCSSVTIAGMDNKITLDKIDKQLTVTGINNTVTYKAGAPKIDNLGSGNTINRG
ncbi:MAG: DUF3060 domain-containing protein [Mycobacterium sp.]|uniref:DUF3060 domain-containing protein n=1 Tax=Mycobacterium sp. TaxID=1785 RepID=UPI00261EACB9|nr:DUF3060 domain-containing protein [Mycobacterium sp.]MDI3314612.1 DUF3060 domain-containing protein [Mycobacterium sp.]